MKDDLPRLRDLFRGERGPTALGASALVILLGAGVLVIALSFSRRPDPPRAAFPKPSVVAVEPAPLLPEIAPEAPKYVWQVWPPAETPIIQASPDKEAKAAAPTKNVIAEPAPPSIGELREVAAWTRGGPDTLRKARELLLDPARPSTLKLAAIEKLRGVAVEEAVPALLEFLESPAPGGGAYTKPSAVKVLLDFGHPLADDALRKLASTAADERVRLSIAHLSRRETGK